MPEALRAGAYMERTLNWYKKQGTEEESLKAEFYLGMAYAHAGKSEQAMDIYAHIYAIAEEKEDYQLMGYTCSYMADLYFDYEYTSKSLEKKKEAAFWLKKANNSRSYVCALRDICMNYAAMDSLSLALTYLQKADSICQTLNDINVYRSILNAYGNIYQMKGEYKSAENYFYQALNKDANPVPDYFALTSLYIETNQLQKAKDILQKIPIDEGINRYVVYWDLYEIAKREGNFEQAIHYLEQYTDINDSLTSASNESKVLEIENRYKHQCGTPATANGTSADKHDLPDSGINRDLDLPQLPQTDGKETLAATSGYKRNPKPAVGSLYRNRTEKRFAETFGGRRKGIN